MGYRVLLVATIAAGSLLVGVTDAEAKCGNNKCDRNDARKGCPEECEPQTVCGDGTCDAGEDVNNCAADCGVCGDSVCTAGLGEDCASCENDCGACGPVCGDSVCEGGEDCSSCSADCGACGPVCGDSVCEGGEDCSSCSADCGACGPVCGDSVCEGGEDVNNCAADCGVCGDSVCTAGLGEDCSSCSADCGACGPVCGDSVCEGGEDCSSCSADCGACGPVCGDSVCEGGEDCSSCSADCGACGPVCGDSVCDAGEDCGNCAADCVCASFPTKLSGIGNSIMQAYNARSSSSPLAGDTPNASFARGTDPVPYSVYQRYQDTYGLAEGMQFVSVSGAEFVGGSDNGAAQAAAICAQAVKPDRVVVLLGGNDVCNRGSGLSDPMARVAAMYTTEQLGNAVSATLDQLGQCLPANARVHVLSVPRVDGLFDVGLSQGCQSRWDSYLIFFSTNICRIVTGGSIGYGNSTLAARQAVGANIDGYNAELAARVSAAQASYGVDFTTDWVGPMSSNPDTSVGAYQFRTGDLSNADCFHPWYQTGQAKLACAAWESWEGDPANVPACLQ